MTITAKEPEIESRRLSSPVRVRIPAFDLVIVPGDPDLTTYGARVVRDAAEDLFESYLINYNFGGSATYDYAGLTGIENVIYDDSNLSEAKSVIQVTGGMVVFKSGSRREPTVQQIEDMFGESLYPSNSDATSLTEVLQSNDMFSYVESSSFRPFRRSLSPSSSPSSFKPSAMTSSIPTDFTSLSSSPSFNLKDILPLIGSTTTSSQDDSTIFGTISIGATLMVVVVGLVVSQHVLRKQKWKIDAPHELPKEEEIEIQKSLGAQSCNQSETNSIFSMFLGATGMQQISRVVESPKTVPQSCSCSSSEQGSLSEFGTEPRAGESIAAELIAGEPPVVQVYSINELGEKKIENVEFTSEEDSAPSIPPSQCEKITDEVMPDHHEFTSVDISATEGFEKWSDWSSLTFSAKNELDTAGNDAAFEPDSTWDFQDNEKDKNDNDDLDPFYTPAEPSNSFMGIFNPFKL